MPVAAGGGHRTPGETATTGLGLRRRFAVLGTASVGGAVLFLPFLSAASGEPVSALWPFVVAASAVSVAAA